MTDNAKKNADVNFELLHRLYAGDVEAMSTLYDLMYKVLMVIAVSVLGKEYEVEAKSIVQGFFKAFWEERMFRKIRHPGAISGYMIRHVHKLCLNFKNSKN